MDKLEPLTPDWIADFQRRVVVRMTPVQRCAAERIWDWFERLWEMEQVDSEKFKHFQNEMTPYFKRLELSTDFADCEAAVADLIGALDAVDQKLLILGRLHR